jgi:hypothetical protein
VGVTFTTPNTTNLTKLDKPQNSTTIHNLWKNLWTTSNNNKQHLHTGLLTFEMLAGCVGVPTPNF